MKMRVSSSRAFVCVSVLTGMFLAGFLSLYSRTTAFTRKSSASNERPAEGATNKAPDAEKKASVLAAYSKLPLAFERNKGQADPQVQYLTRGSGYELFLTSKGAVLALWQPRKSEGGSHRSSTLGSSTLAAPSEARSTRKASVLRLQFVGANPSPAITGIDKLERKANYFIGNNRADWVTDVPSYGRVEYHSVYPGIDLDFYGNQRHLEYDFAVAPGADPKAISFKLQGGKSAHIDSRGNLVMNIPSGSVSFKKPLIYQMEDGQRREIAGGYLLAKNDEVAFTVSNYDPTRPLIIDPVLDYSTYLGGSALGDQAFSVAVDGNGNAFVTGQTFNATFPLSTSPATVVGLGTPDAGISSNGGAFVSEINPAGTAELYFSYLSGDGGDIGYSVAVDPVANSTCANGLVNSFCVYVTGQTFSDDFPVGSVVTPYNAIAPTGGAPTAGNAFITKLNPYVSGATSLLYSSYLASSNGGDIGHGIAVDSSQHAYITGIALATPGAPPAFPILNGAQTTLPNTNGNAFLTVLNTTASSGALLYSTYLGGNDANAGTSELGIGDIGWAVAVDSSEIAYIVGTTPSTNFPNLNSTGTFPNIKGWAVVNGSNSTNEGFLAAVNTTLTGVNSLVYSTYVGGDTADRTNGVALAGSGVVYITGVTRSSDFTLTQTGTTGQFPSSFFATGLAFITKLNTTVSGAPSYSVLLGGTGGDIGNGIQLDTLGNVIVAGTTQSGDFPVTPGAFKSSLGGAVGDAFIAKINPTATGSAGLLYSTYFGGSGQASPPIPDQGNGVALDTASNAIIAGQTYSSDFPTSSGAFQSSLSGTSAGFVSKLTLLPVLAFGAPCTFNLAVTPATSCALGFGNQTFHVASAAMTFALTNNTGSNITLTIPPTTSGTNAGDFVAAAVSGSSPACTTTLAAGASCGIGVTFTPSTAAAEAATLTVSYSYNNGTSTPASGTQTVALTGTGTAPTVALNPATTLNFPTAQPVGTTSTALPVTVTNTGLGNLIFTSAPSTGSTEFAISSTTCSTSSPLAQNANCTINITFTPSATGSRSATLTIADNATSSPQTVSLTGTGVASAPIATISPASLALVFGGQTDATTSAAQTVTVKNTGNATLTISGTPSITGTNASDFAISSNTCTSGASVAVNATCAINVTFTPPAGASGSRTATFSVADNASGSPQQVSLTGTAIPSTPVATISPSPVAFGGQLVTTTSTAQTVTVKNTGNAALTISGTPSITGTNASDFAISSNTCTSGASVAANATCTINVTFTPPAGASGSRTATLSVADNASGSPQTVSLTGTAWDFSISAQPITVAPGSSGTIAVTVTGIGGFTGQVTLACSGTIPQGSCAGPASPVAAPGTGNVTVTTHGLVAPPSAMRLPPISRQQLSLVILALMLLFGLPLAGRTRTRLGLTGVAALLIFAAGCANTPPTPANTYSVTITGTSGTVSHSITVNVTVN